eukprot:498539-Lingulodinium_polyedra.AAC.1
MAVPVHVGGMPSVLPHPQGRQHHLRRSWGGRGGLLGRGGACQGAESRACCAGRRAGNFSSESSQTIQPRGGHGSKGH